MSEERLIGMSRGGGAMTCMRCGGFVIIDRYAWPGSEMENLEVPQAHCVNCGWTEDPVIRANRMLMAMGKLLHLNVPRVVRDPLEWSDSSPVARVDSSGAEHSDSQVRQDPSKAGGETSPEMFVQSWLGRMERKERRADGTEQQKRLDRR